MLLSYCLLTEGSVWEETSDWWRGSGMVNYLADAPFWCILYLI